MGHIERRQKEKENVRKNILETALNIAISDGWDGVTIRKIANRIEYTPPVIYEYFKNKEDLLNEVALMGQQMLHEGFDIVKEKESAPRKILMLLSLNHWEFAFNHKKLYELMFSSGRAVPNAETHPEVRKIKDLFLELTRDQNLAEEQLFSWMCLQQGFIYNIKQIGLPPELQKIDPKELYLRIMDRFISNI